MTFDEFKSDFVVHRMHDGEYVEAFECGENDLNNFIMHDASLYLNEKLAVTYIVYKKDNPKKVEAFFSLSNDRISVSDFDNKTKYNKFSKRFNNHKRLKSYPAAKIGRLAVSSSMKGNGIGSILLYFIKTYFLIDNKTGCRFITVDALASAVPFYEKNNFIPLNDEDINDRTRLLYFDLNDLK